MKCFINLEEAKPTPKQSLQETTQWLRKRLEDQQIEVFDWPKAQALESIEQAHAQEQGADFFKFNTNTEMLEALQQHSNS